MRLRQCHDHIALPGLQLERPAPGPGGGGGERGPGRGAREARETPSLTAPHTCCFFLAFSCCSKMCNMECTTLATFKHMVQWPSVLSCLYGTSVLSRTFSLSQTQQFKKSRKMLPSWDIGQLSQEPQGRRVGVLRTRVSRGQRWAGADTHACGRGQGGRVPPLAHAHKQPTEAAQAKRAIRDGAGFRRRVLGGGSTGQVSVPGCPRPAVPRDLRSQWRAHVSGL